MKTRAVLLTSALLVTMSLAACGEGSGSSSAGSTTSPPATSLGGGGTGPGTPAPKPLPTQTKVTIGTSFLAENYAGVLLAKQLGEFEKENLDVSVEVLPTPQILTSMVQGNVVLQPAGISAPMLNGTSANDSYRVVGFMYDTAGDSKEGIWVRDDYFKADGAADVDKVRGMKFSLGPPGLAGASVHSLVKWLTSIGLTTSDIEMVPTGTQGDMLAAMKSGALGGAYFIPPFWQQLEAEKLARAIPDTRANSAAYIMPTKLIKESPDVAAAILRAMLRVHRTYLTGDYHKNSTVMEALAAATKTPLDAIINTPTTFSFTDNLESQEAHKQTMELQSIWLKVGVLGYKEGLSEDRIIDLSLARRVVAGG